MIAAVASLLGILGFSADLARKLAPWAMGLAALLLVISAFAIWNHSDNAAAIERDRLEANNDQLVGQVDADAAAADQRVEDVIAQIQQEEAYVDAITEPEPGDSPDPGVRLACEQLRRQGENTAAIPACGGR